MAHWAFARHNNTPWTLRNGRFNEMGLGKSTYTLASHLKPDARRYSFIINCLIGFIGLEVIIELKRRQ